MRASLFGGIVTLGLIGPAGASTSHELSGYVTAERRLFGHAPMYADQERHSTSVAFQFEYYREWDTGPSMVFVPFGRIDGTDSERRHFDVRELNYLYPTEDWELRLGIGKVFWGATEFVHLVDIVNQTDFVENIDGEDKLGQPLAHLSVPRDWGVVDLFLLPYFRERTFPGRKGRLRPVAVVDTDDPMYESSQEERHVDVVGRYSHTINNLDVGIYHFVGTGREPTLLLGLDAQGRPRLTPYYEQINQSGLDLQLVTGSWLWKLESLYRTGQGDGFFASVGGFEYTLMGIAATGMDLGIITEYAYDERGDRATTAYENDAMFGLRLAVNDAPSTDLLVGLIQDLDSRTQVLRLEASRRIWSRWKLSLQAIWDIVASAFRELVKGPEVKMI